MLTARRVPPALLRHVRRSTTASRSIRRLYASSTPSPSLLSRRTLASAPPSNTPGDGMDDRLRLLVKLAPSNPDAAMTVFAQTQGESGVRLTGNQASGLLEALAQHNRLDECEQLWDDCTGRGLTLKPFAYAAVTRALVQQGQCDRALSRVQQLMMGGESEPWVYDLAMKTAIKARRNDVVADVLKTWGVQDVPNEVQGRDGILRVLNGLRDRGVQLSEPTLRSLDKFATSDRGGDVATVVSSLMRSAGVERSIDCYSAAITGRGRTKRWGDVIELYESMTNESRLRLDALPLSVVITAHASVNNKELNLQAQKIFENCSFERNGDVLAAGLMAYLKNDKTDIVRGLLESMERRGVALNHLDIKQVVQAHIRCGSIEKAELLLQKEKERLIDKSADCYRELIKHHVEKDHDPQHSFDLYMEMIRSNSRLPLDDWKRATELAMQLSDSSKYWKLRKLMSGKAPSIKKMIPFYVIFSGEDKAKFSNGATLASESPELSRSRALELVKEIQDTEGFSMPPDTASKLLLSLAKEKCADECVEVLRYCRTEGIPLRVSEYVQALHQLYSDCQFSQALQLFHGLVQNDVEIESSAFGFAMDAAIKTKQYELADDLFQRLISGNTVRDEASGADSTGDVVAGIIKVLRERGNELSESALRSLVIFANKSRQSDLALELLSVAKSNRLEPMVDVYESALVACGHDHRWSDVVKVYEDMPDHLHPQLPSRAICAVVQAHVNSDGDKLKSRGMELFDSFKDKMNRFTWNLVLETHLKANEFESLLAVAGEMQQWRMNWNEYTTKMAISAHLRSGSVETARQMLSSSRTLLKFRSSECYRELIEHYTDTLRDPQAASELYVEMIQDNARLPESDWHNALKVSMQLPDRSLYWEIRELMSRSAPALSKNLPAHLQLQRQSKRRAPKATSTISRLAAADPAQALQFARGLQSTPGVSLSTNVASVLLNTLSQHDDVDECVTVLNYCYEQGISLKPFAQTAAFKALNDGLKYAELLLLFEDMRKNKPTFLAAWRYAAALDAASQLDQPKVVADIFHRLVFDGADSREVSLTGVTVKDLLQDVRRQGVAPSEFALNALGVYAEESSQPDLLLDVFSMMRREGKTPAIRVSVSALTTYASAGRWEDVIDVYESMTRKAREHLTSYALGRVIMAYSNADTDEKKLRALEIVDQHDEHWPREVWNAVLYVHLQVGECEAVLPLAEDMLAQGKRWNSFTYKMLVLADIRSGNVDRAESRLRDTIDLMDDKGAECYRELIPYYADTRGDLVAASVRCLEMVEKSDTLIRSDWWSALELVMQLPDDSVYWHVRKQIQERAPHLRDRIPKRLLLSESGRQQGSEAVLREEKDSEPSLRPEEELVAPQPIQRAQKLSAEGTTPPEPSAKGDTLFGWIRNKLWPTD